MQTVTVVRTIDAPPSDVREAMLDLEPFTRAAGFDEVAVDGREIRVANGVGVTEISLELSVVDDPDADLAYEQRTGIFAEMRTAYSLEERDGGTEVEATTEFALDVALVGDLLDSTLISRQRRKELTAQLDYLEGVAAG